MKSILVVVILIISIFLFDHFNLLQTNTRYPASVNNLIKTFTESDIFTLNKPVKNRILYQWESDDGIWQISDQPPSQGAYKTINLQTNNLVTDKTFEGIK